jgi:hypothetical protein
MNALKSKNMMKVYNGHTGSSTISAVMEFIPQELLATLTGKQLGLIMNAVDSAFHTGKASTGAEMIDSNCVYVENLKKAIEWQEVGAEYEQLIENANVCGFNSQVTKSIKVKPGVLTLKFVE